MHIFFLVFYFAYIIKYIVGHNRNETRLRQPQMQLKSQVGSILWEPLNSILSKAVTMDHFFLKMKGILLNKSL